MNFSSRCLESWDRGFTLFSTFEFKGVKTIGELLSHLLSLLGGISDGYLWVRTKPRISAFACHWADITKHPVATTFRR
ncbi:hypothetical protein ATO50_09885 [Aeromonas hydrophila]|nr:hypothetical protein ATO50_09885 [Aeromonas hydrophila]